MPAGLLDSLGEPEDRVEPSLLTSLASCLARPAFKAVACHRPLEDRGALVAPLARGLRGVSPSGRSACLASTGSLCDPALTLRP